MMKEIKQVKMEQEIMPIDQNVVNAEQTISELEEAISNEDIFGIKDIYEYSNFHIDWESVSNSLFEKWDALIDEANEFLYYK